MLDTYYSYNAVITDPVDHEDHAVPLPAPPVPSAPPEPPVSVQAPILQDLAITYTRPHIPQLPQLPPYQVVVSMPPFPQLPQVSDIVPPDLVSDSVKNISNHPEPPHPPPQACALDVFEPTPPFPPFIFIVHQVIFTFFAIKIIFQPDHPPPHHNQPEFHDPPLAHAQVGFSTFTLIAVVPISIPDNIWLIIGVLIPIYAVLDHADPPILALLPQFHPAHEESVIVIAVFVMLLLLLHGNVDVAFTQALPPAQPAPPVPAEAFDQLFCIVPPDIVSVQSTNTLNQAGFNVAPVAIVRLL